MGKISVVLADWQVLFREGVHFTLSGEEDVEVIAEATDNDEALEFIESNPPSIAVLNANHSELSGIRVTRRIRQNFPSVSVILVMDTDDEEQFFLAMKSGASACLTKDTDPDELVDTIREVAQVGHPISEALLRPGLAARTLDEFEVFSQINKQVNNLLARLSPTETEILQHIASGSPIEQVSETLGISELTIRHQLGLTLAKLVANDHNREVMEIAQSVLPSTFFRAGKPSLEYVTREEFAAFRQNVTERLKSFISELNQTRGGGKM